MYENITYALLLNRMLEKALSIPKAREELAQLQKETEQEGF